MDIADQGFKKWAKITCPARQVLAIVLIWQASHSLVLGQFGSTVQQFPQVVPQRWLHHLVYHPQSEPRKDH